LEKEKSEEEGLESVPRESDVTKEGEEILGDAGESPR